MNNEMSKTDRWLLTGFIIFLALLLMLIIFSGTGKGSDVSNWVIAAANITMAAAAVKAWRAARRFLGEFFAQEGYRLAIELVNENVIHLGIDNKFMVFAQKSVVICSELNGEKLTDILNFRFLESVQKFEALYNTHITLLSNIRTLSFRMETYGIFVAEDKKDALTKMILALDEMSRLGRSLLQILQENTNAYNLRVKSRTNFYLPFNSQHIASMQEHLGKINLEWNKMVASRDQLLSDGKHARKLFVVRDN